MKNTEGEAKRRGRNPTKNVQQQYKQKKETKVSPRLINFMQQSYYKKVKCGKI